MGIRDSLSMAQNRVFKGLGGLGTFLMNATTSGTDFPTNGERQSEGRGSVICAMLPS